MKKNYFLLLLAAALVFGQAQAQTVVRIGMANTASSSNQFPFAGAVRTGQYIYDPAELANPRSGFITSLIFIGNNSASGPDNTLTDLVITLKQVTYTAFTSATFETDVDTVFAAGSYTLPDKGPFGEQEIILDQPFAYDSSKSLIVGVSFSGNTGGRGYLSKSRTGGRVVITTVNPGVPALQNTLNDIAFMVSLGPVAAKARAGAGQLSIYPNPARQQAHLTLPEGATLPASLTLYSSSGSAHQVPAQQLGRSASLNLEQLPRGLYHLQLPHGQQVYRASLVKE